MRKRAPAKSFIVRQFNLLQRELLVELQGLYGHRLVSVVVYGSIGRGDPRAKSDVDVLIVADPLPRGRGARVDEFAVVRERLRPSLAMLAEKGIHTYVSPVFKTPAEVEIGSLLFLDMLADGRVLVDRDGFWGKSMAGFKNRLERLGARKIYEGERWYWDLKPDYRPGEVFEI